MVLLGGDSLLPERLAPRGAPLGVGRSDLRLRYRRARLIDPCGEVLALQDDERSPSLDPLALFGGQLPYPTGAAGLHLDPLIRLQAADRFDDHVDVLAGHQGGFDRNDLGTIEGL